MELTHLCSENSKYSALKYIYFLNYSFHGADFPVTALPYAPYWDHIKNDDSIRYTGTDYLMLVTIGEALNFKVKVLKSKNWNEVRII